MRRASPAIASVLLLAATCICWPAFAQDKPADFLRRVLAPPAVTEPTADRQLPDPNAPAKLCAWQSTSDGTAFVRSGFCEASSQLAVGASCRCNSSSVGRPDGKWLGTIILAPASDQSPVVVR